VIEDARNHKPYNPFSSCIAKRYMKS